MIPNMVSSFFFCIAILTDLFSYFSSVWLGWWKLNFVNADSYWRNILAVTFYSLTGAYQVYSLLTVYTISIILPYSY